MALIKKVVAKDVKSLDKNIINKTNNAVTLGTKIKGNTNILTTINSINTLVSQKLGHYKEKYQILRDDYDIDEYFYCIAKNKISAIDTETTGLNPISDELVGICLYTPNRKPAYIPYGHISYITGQRIKNQPDKEFLQQCFNSLENKDVKWIFHNAKFDMRFLKNQFNIRLKAYWDTMIASKCIDETEPAGLKQLHLKFCKSEDAEAMTFDKLFEGIPFSLIPIEVAYLYAAGDAIKTFELYQYQKDLLTSRPMSGCYTVFKEIEMPLIDVIADMEDTGVSIDMKYANELAIKYHKVLEEKEKAVYDIIDSYKDRVDDYKLKNPINKLSTPININSPSQLAILLYDIIQLQSVDKRNPRGTGEDILKLLDTALCKAILEYRSVGKLVSTYIDTLPTMVNPITNRLHCSFNQYGADTGRLSSSNPNFQNIPSHNKDIRKMFVAKEGYCFVGADFSQQEPLVTAHLSNDEHMRAAFIEGKDIYSTIASIAFKQPYEECREFRVDGSVNKEGKEHRTQSKSIVLGVLYGRSISSIAEQLGISSEDAKVIYDTVLDAFPALKNFMEESQQMAKDFGYVTTVYGRRRHIRNMMLQPYEFYYENIDKEVSQTVIDKYTKILSKTYYKNRESIKAELKSQGILVKENTIKLREAERQCVNSRVQGSAADITKKAMIAVYNDELLRQLDCHILMQIHDEIQVECPLINAKRVGERLSQLMINAAKDRISIPMKCDVEITDRWYGEPIKFDEE